MITPTHEHGSGQGLQGRHAPAPRSDRARAYSVSRVAEICGVDRSRVYRWIYQGVGVRGWQGEPIRLGEPVQLPGGLRVLHEQLVEFLTQLQGARRAVQRAKGRGVDQAESLRLTLPRELEAEEGGGDLRVWARLKEGGPLKLVFDPHKVGEDAPWRGEGPDPRSAEGQALEARLREEHERKKAAERRARAMDTTGGGQRRRARTDADAPVSGRR